MALIVIGGIGFMTWDDIKTNGLSGSGYRMQSKVILTDDGAFDSDSGGIFFLL